MSELRKVTIIILLIGVIIDITALLIFQLSFLYSIGVSLVFCVPLFVIILAIFSQMSKPNPIFKTDEDDDEQADEDINAIKYKRSKM